MDDELSEIHLLEKSYQYNRSTILPITTQSNDVEWGLDRDKLISLSVIDIVTSSLSVIGAASIVIASLCIRKSRNREVHPVFHLSLADFLASLSLLLGAILFISDHTANETLCQFVSGFTTAFFGVTFFLTLSYALQIYVRQRQRRQAMVSNNAKQSHTRRWFIVVYCLSWLLPICMQIAMFAAQRLKLDRLRHNWTEIILTDTRQDDIDCSSCLPIFHYNEDKCYRTHHVSVSWRYTYKLMFLIPLSFIMSCNVFLYILAIREYRKSEASRGTLTRHQHEIVFKMKKKATLFFGVFVFCWLPSIILGFISLARTYDMNKIYFLYIIQSFTTPLQGFLNSLIYGWQRKTFVEALRSDSSIVSTQNYAAAYQTFTDDDDDAREKN